MFKKISIGAALSVIADNEVSATKINQLNVQWNPKIEDAKKTKD